MASREPNANLRRGLCGLGVVLFLAGVLVGAQCNVIVNVDASFGADDECEPLPAGFSS
jgi:hypothetical protein